jgi:hypothetical protein
MGLTFADAQNLLQSRRGATGGRVVMLGRQNLLLHPGDLKRLRAAVGTDSVALAWLQDYRWGSYADGFFRHVLKFEDVESIDYSPFEGASIIHDFGEPLPEHLQETFDLAVDGGTLEHVFNFPVAAANLMKLVRVGGIVYAANPSNNLCGHGFYQFSPELMYRIFSPKNGFELIFVRLLRSRYASVALSSGHAVYDVSDPAQAGGRVNLQNSKPVVIMTMARRVRHCEPFAEKVLQSDYAREWVSPSQDARGLRGFVKSAVGWDTPRPWSGPIINAYLRLHASFQNRHSFRRVRGDATLDQRTG